MRICDLCEQVTPRLEILPEEFGQTEVCDPCHRRLLNLLQACEQEATLIRIKLRQAALEKWKLERSPPEQEISPP